MAVDAELIWMVLGNLDQPLEAFHDKDSIDPNRLSVKAHQHEGSAGTVVPEKSTTGLLSEDKILTSAVGTEFAPVSGLYGTVLTGQCPGRDKIIAGEEDSRDGDRAPLKAGDSVLDPLPVVGSELCRPGRRSRYEPPVVGVEMLQQLPSDRLGVCIRYRDSDKTWIRRFSDKIEHAVRAG